MNQKSMYIGKLAEVVGISPRMLRYYEKLGLLSSNRVNNYRVYDHVSICEASSTKMYQKIGIPLKDIKTFLEDSEHNPSQAQNQIAALIVENEETILSLLWQSFFLRRLDHLMKTQTGPHMVCFVCGRERDTPDFLALNLDVICPSCLEANHDFESAENIACISCGPCHDREVLRGQHGEICLQCFDQYR